MASITKTAGQVLLEHTAITHPDTLVGAAVDVSTKLAATLILFHSSVEATANTNPGTFLVQVSGAESGNEDWATVAVFTASATTADTEALSGAESPGATVLEVASTAGFVAGDYLYIQNTTLADGEWNRLQEIATNVSLTVIDGITNAQSSSSIVWNDADIFVCQLDLTAVKRLRAIFQHEGATGANAHVKGLLVTGDSIG